VYENKELYRLAAVFCAAARQSPSRLSHRIDRESTGPVNCLKHWSALPVYHCREPLRSDESACIR